MKHYLCLLSALCLVTFLACEREVDLRPEGNGSVVVECILSEEPVQTLRLSLTDIASATLSNAEITLTDETAKKEVGLFTFQGEGLWTLDYQSIPSHMYQLTVEIDGFEKIEARTEMPARPKIEYTIMPSAHPQFMDFHGFPDWEIGTRFKINSLPKDAVWICGMNYDESSGKHVPASTIATSLESQDLFNLAGGTYWNEFNPQSEAWFEEMYDVKAELGGSFTGGSHWWYHFPKEYRTSMYRYVVGNALHDTFLRIPSIEENDNRIAADPLGYFSVAGDFQGFTYGRYDENGMYTLETGAKDGYVLFMSFSKDYDCYLKELLMEEARVASDNDFSSLFSRENIHTNIENGLGIFGAKTTQKLPWVKHNTHAGNKAIEW